MKTLRYALLLSAMAVALASCGIKEVPYTGPSTDMLFLCIGVRDSAGNNLVAQLGDEYYKSDPNRYKYMNEVNPDKYTLTVMRADGRMDSDPGLIVMKFDDQYAACPQKEDDWTYEVSGNWYLVSQVKALAVSDLSLYEPLTYTIKCPSVFGDDDEHTIEAWWKTDTENSTKDIRFFECTKASFDGRAITPVKGANYSFLDIVPEK